MSTIQVRPPGRVRLTVEEFARIQVAGLFDGRHVQLLDGELYEVTKNPPHNFAVSALAGPTHDVGRHLRSQPIPLNLSCERKTICNILFGNWLWQQPRSSYCTLSMLLVL